MSTPTSSVTTHPVVPSSGPNDFDSTWGVRVRRASWGAILGGFFTAAAMQMLLSLLGLAFGFWSIDPMTEDNPLSGLGTAAGVWWVITGLISLAAGGWVAGYLAGFTDAADGAIHGVVTWGLLTVASFWMAGSALGSLFNASANALGTGLQTAADWAVPDDSKEVRVVVVRQGEGGRTFAEDGQHRHAAGQAQDRESRVNYEQVAAQLREILQETGKESLQPDQLQQAGQRLIDRAKSAAADAAKNPDDARGQLNQVLDAFFSEWQNVKQDLDKEAVANLLAANTDLSREEALQTVDRWQNEYDEMSREVRQGSREAENEVAAAWQDTKQEVVQQYQEAKKATLHATEETLDAIGHAAFWSFVSTLLGLVAAAGGGALGVRHRPAHVTAAART